jgi:predicted transcriptional regulator
MTEPWDKHIAHWARKYRGRQQRLELIHDNLKAAVRSGVAAGMTEQAAADAAGVTRQTVRKWLGKDKR